MFNLTSAHRYFLCNEPTDMRKGFDGLSRLVQTHFKADPMNGSVYVFLNKNRNLHTYLEKKKLLNQKIWLIASPILN